MSWKFPNTCLLPLQKSEFLSEIWILRFIHGWIAQSVSFRMHHDLLVSDSFWGFYKGFRENPSWKNCIFFWPVSRFSQNVYSTTCKDDNSVMLKDKVKIFFLSESQHLGLGPPVALFLKKCPAEANIAFMSSKYGHFHRNLQFCEDFYVTHG